jgi:hypothetical protein
VALANNLLMIGLGPLISLFDMFFTLKQNNMAKDLLDPHSSKASGNPENQINLLLTF